MDQFHIQICTNRIFSSGDLKINVYSGLAYITLVLRPTLLAHLLTIEIGYAKRVVVRIYQ